MTADVAVGAVAVAVLAGAAPAYASDLNTNHTCWAVGGDGVSKVDANPAGPGYWNLAEAVRSGRGKAVVGGRRAHLPGQLLRRHPQGHPRWQGPLPGRCGRSITSYGDAVQFGSIDAHSAYSYDGCGDVDDNRIAGISLTPSRPGMVALDEEGHVWAIGDAHYYGEESSPATP